MKTYRIANRTSGHVFGAYRGDTADEAIGAMLADAGCEDEAAEDVIATEIEPEIRAVVFAEHCSAPIPAREIPGEKWADLSRRIERALELAYPEAGVTVEIRQGVSGVGSGAAYLMECETQADESEHCRAIVERAWLEWLKGI